MIVLILACSVPLLSMAAAISWQNYLIASRQSLERVELLREGAMARDHVAIVGARQMMAALAQAPALAVGETQACVALLRDVLLIGTSRYQSIGVADAAGKLRCASHVPGGGGGEAAGDGLAAVATSQWAAGATPFISGPIITLNDDLPPLLPVAFHLGGAAGGMLVALMRLDWLTPPGTSLNRPGGPAAWLVRDDGVPLALNRTQNLDLPPARALRRLLAPTGSLLNARSIGGIAYGYASASLAGGLHLVVGYREAKGELDARTLLMWHLGELAALALLGLAAVVVGANYGMVRPVRRLDEAVRRWRGGDVFDIGPARMMPWELRELARSFAEASLALKDREMQLRSALTQQDLLMQEIHHRVKNNLQIIASLLNLQASRIRQPQARAEFQSARDRVRALATLHRYLYPHGELHTINMRSFLAELCGQLFQAMGETEGDRIQLEIEAPELRMLSDQAVPLSLIVTEVVGNALKFAFPDRRPGRISVRLTEADGVAELVIADDGVGMGAARARLDDETSEPPGAPGVGIGIQLIRGFVRQLRATMTVDESQGTTYVVRLPVHREREAATALEAADAPK
jgi:two-component sensor histidine kinase